MIHIDIYLFPLLTLKASVEQCVYVWLIDADDEKREDSVTWTVVRDLWKHLDLRYAHCKQRSLQRIMSHLSQ